MFVVHSHMRAQTRANTHVCTRLVIRRYLLHNIETVNLFAVIAFRFDIAVMLF